MLLDVRVRHLTIRLLSGFSEKTKELSGLTAALQEKEQAIARLEDELRLAKENKAKQADVEAERKGSGWRRLWNSAK